MIKIFDSNNSAWDEKINFVDESGAYLGYDLAQSCCEDADWFLSFQEEETYNPQLDEGLNKARLFPDYTFDRDYFKEVENEDKFDAGGMAIFKMISDSGPDIYLHLYNVHNGYYGHGFTFKIGEEVVRDGGL